MSRLGSSFPGMLTWEVIHYRCTEVRSRPSEAIICLVGKETEKDVEGVVCIQALFAFITCMSVARCKGCSLVAELSKEIKKSYKSPESYEALSGR